MNLNLNQIQPSTPYIEGVVRFASETDGLEPRQLDHFEVLARHHSEEEGVAGTPKLAQHELMGTLCPDGEKKLRIIPIKLICNEPQNSLTARYEAFDTAVNRMTCAGDGDKASRAELMGGTIAQVSCRGPEACEYANQVGVQCALRVRLLMQIEGQRDAYSLFEFQSGSINTYRTLAAKLQMMYASFGGRLRHVPLELAMFTKSSATSNYMPFYVADVRLRDSMKPIEAITLAKEQYEQENTALLDFAAMEEVIAKMRSNSAWALGEPDSDCPVFSYDRVDRQKLKSREPRPTLVPEGETAIQAVIAKAKGQAQHRDDVAVPADLAGKKEAPRLQATAVDQGHETPSWSTSAIEVPSLPL